MSNMWNKNTTKTYMNNDIEVQKPYIKVVCILDNFSYECLKHECNLIQLHSDSWKETILKEKPDFLLVESAWRGLNNSWNKKVGYLHTTHDSTLEKLVYFCKSLNIPTVFWNKEDPYHHDFFLPATRLFEYIFTSDVGLVERYKMLFNHDRVYDLPFAAQPKIHNPINREKCKLGQVCFAGTWYNNNHEDRRKNMEMILDPALNYNFHIYDRNYNITTNSYRYPNKYQPFIKGFLPYEKMIVAYKRYDVFLNVNSVDDSLTMFSRRVFELLASGTNVISSFSAGIENMFPNIVKLSKNNKDTEKHLSLLLNNKEIRDRLSLKGLREILGNHTYTHRFEKMLDKIGISYNRQDNSGVSIITFVSSSNSMQKAIENFQRQNYDNKELIILTKSNTESEELKEKLKDRTNIKILFTSNQRFTGELLKECMDKIKFNYISQFEDDYYAEYYLRDLMNAFKYTDASIVGKQSCYMYIDKTDTLVYYNQNLENQYVNNLCTSAMIIRKDILAKINLKDIVNGLDEAFMEQCIKNNIKMYSTDRFNYVQILRPSTRNLFSLTSGRKYLDDFEKIDTKVNYMNYVTV